MVSFPIHDDETAPEGSRALFDLARQLFEVIVPNLSRVTAGSPALLECHLTLIKLLGTTRFNPIEQLVIYLAASYENRCTYCVTGHSGAARMQHLADEDIMDALRGGAPLADSRLEALRRSTATMISKRGWLDDAHMEAFLAAGYNREQMLDVVLGVGAKILSNYTNRVAGTPVDEIMKPFTWRLPSVPPTTG